MIVFVSRRFIIISIQWSWITNTFLYNLFLASKDFQRLGVNQGFLVELFFFICFLTKGKHLLNTALKDIKKDWYACSASSWVYTSSQGMTSIIISNRSRFLSLNTLKLKTFSLSWWLTEVTDARWNTGKWSDISEQKTPAFHKMLK